MRRDVPRITSLESAFSAARNQEAQAVISDIIARVKMKAKDFVNTTVESGPEEIFIPE